MGVKRQGRGWQQQDRIHGFLFDGATFVANFLLVGSALAVPLARFGDRSIGILLGVGVMTQLLGALLKRAPLQRRIETTEGARSESRENILGCLTFIHFIFFLLVTAVSLALVGVIELTDASDGKTLAWVLLSAAVAAVTSGLVWQAVRQPTGEKDRPLWWRYQEIPADALLWISATVLNRFFWRGLLLESEPPTYMGFSMRAMTLIVAVSALFFVFYVPARLLFLAEDYKYPATWFRLWLVAMLPLMTIVLFR